MSAIGSEYDPDRQVLNDNGFDVGSTEDLPALAALKRSSADRIERLSTDLEARKVRHFSALERNPLSYPSPCRQHFKMGKIIRYENWMTWIQLNANSRTQEF